jgi:hypothetical protein
MAEPQANAPNVALESGTYEIIRNRLLSHSQELRKRVDTLNAARKEIFGSIEFELLSTDRITTKNNCVPRDMLSVGNNQFIFGYNVQMGLKSETAIEDVFAIYEYKDKTFREAPLDLIKVTQFQSDFKELYAYYKETTLSKFHTIGPHLYMVFQTGKTFSDIKVFKWRLDDKGLQYLGNRFDHEIVFPPQHEFEWKRAHRDLHRSGRHPHISIDDRVFVETVGGDLTIKIEDNTASGEGIFSEPVDNKDQTLDDAEIYYGIVGNLILLKVRPFQEQKFRYIVFSEKVSQARRIDQIADSCVLLPDGQGLIFHNGYYLQNGEYKVFETEHADMKFASRIDAPNGEDYVYIFYNTTSGVYVLLSYNRIEQKVKTPLICNGYSLFESGELICFKCNDEPKKNHALQIWQTPYFDHDVVQPTKNDSFLFKIGNAPIVACMAECFEVLNLLSREDTYANLYLDLVKKTTDIIDAYFWLDDKRAFNLKEVVEEIKKAATSAVDEFEKVASIKRNTAQELRKYKEKAEQIAANIDYSNLRSIDIFVGHLTSLRTVRGEIISLRELRYIDLTNVDTLEKTAAEHIEKLSALCVEFLLKPEALQPYQKKIDDFRGVIEKVGKVAEAVKLEEELAKASLELEMLIEIVSNLKIADSTETTRIIESISAIYATLNQTKANLKNRKRELLGSESEAQFDAQLKLLNQGVTNYLDLCDSAKKCDEYLTKLMVQIEELEGRFADFDEYVQQLTTKREEVYNAFDSKKLQLTESRNKRANSLLVTADRILNSIKNRADGIKTVNELNGYFASDLMIDKVRDVVEQLQALEDTVKADDIQSRLKTLRENAIRQLKDRLELFVDGENIIQFGAHKFSVNTQALDLTIVPREGIMFYHLSGTNYFEKVQDPRFLETKAVWDQELISENSQVYRSEYLAYLIFQDLLTGKTKSISDAASLSDELLLDLVRQFMAPRHIEGYVKGVHDSDAAAILKTLIATHQNVQLLRYSPVARACARFAWNEYPDAATKGLLEAKLKSFGILGQLFEKETVQCDYIAEILDVVRQSLLKCKRFPEDCHDDAAEYLFHQLSQDDRFVISSEAAKIKRDFHSYLTTKSFARKFADARKTVEQSPIASLDIIHDWLRAFIASDTSYNPVYLEEAAILLMYDSTDKSKSVDATIESDIKNLTGTHPVLQERTYHFHYHQFVRKLRKYSKEVVPLFEHFTSVKRELIEKKRESLRLQDFKPKVLSSFVRNKLIDQFYLPLLGSNLAKQIGVAGEDKRTDRMGMLLLVSPPGYGKTTLVEYVANRLGLVFMKINGPALGHKVTSLDPADAPNAAAREEINKLNLALEMGDNVMICLDDIQHCNPEFLQKFISLCDAQRKIEGVFQSTPRTYDLRGKKVAVVMAGNPYTESGEKFKIPDMLSNRADTYNLGDIVSNQEQAFKNSYLENAITSNRILQTLNNKSQKDVYAIIRYAETGSGEGVEFDSNFSPEEISEMVSVMKFLIRLRDTVLRINQEYIKSAGQADAYRTEPPFKLQGSYRNMNRLAEKVLPIMNDKEVTNLLQDHYKNEAQTLTTGAEANLLKFKEVFNLATEQELQRWNDIKTTFRQRQIYAGTDPNDPVGRVVLQLSAFREGLESLKGVLADGLQRQQISPEQLEALAGSRQIEASLSPETVKLIRKLLFDGRDGDAKVPTIASAPQETIVQEGGSANIESHPNYQVEVRYSVPDVFTKMIEQQFQVIQGWAKQQAPQLKDGDQTEGLKSEIQQVLEEYRTLITTLKAERPKQHRKSTVKKDI